MGRTDTRDLIPTLPARLTELRVAAGLSQQELATAAGTSVFSISKIEKGKRSLLCPWPGKFPLRCKSLWILWLRCQVKKS